MGFLNNRSPCNNKEYYANKLREMDNYIGWHGPAEGSLASGKGFTIIFHRGRLIMAERSGALVEDVLAACLRELEETGKSRRLINKLREVVELASQEP